MLWTSECGLANRTFVVPTHCVVEKEHGFRSFAQPKCFKRRKTTTSSLSHGPLTTHYFFFSIFACALHQKRSTHVQLHVLLLASLLPQSQTFKRFIDSYLLAMTYLFLLTQIRRSTSCRIRSSTDVILQYPEKRGVF
jgi:hypothetical protein